jgi:NAD(P)-dependent dehydrogenase (short-subunit alcohol dehydrogenase family)
MTLSGAQKSGSLAGRVALVSGGAQGIGRAIVERFQREGAQAILLDNDGAAGEATVKELARCPTCFPPAFLYADLQQQSEIRSALATVKERYGRVDILVNNAGVEIAKPFADVTLADWDRILDVNLRGAFLLAQAALPLFPAQGGAIVNISSIHATHAFPDSTAYACAKAALVALSRNLALELAPRHIRVNTVSPGYIDTRLWDDYLRQSPDPDSVASQTTALHPLGRRGVPADVAEATLFFAADGSSFITGTDLVVDGGLTVRTHD